LNPNGLKSDKPLLFSSLPPQIQADIRKAQKEAAEGHVVSDEEVFRELDEWLEKD
jgi:predicted transcriptional regulator